MLKKQISGLRWEYHLERYIGTLIPGSNCAGINCFRWRGFLSLNILYTPNWILNSPKLRRKRRNAVLSYSGQMLLHIPDFPCGYQYMYSFRNKINLVHSSTYNFCKKVCFVYRSWCYPTVDHITIVSIGPSLFGPSAEFYSLIKNKATDEGVCN